MEMNDIIYRFEGYTHLIMIRIRGLIPTAEACLDPEKKNPSKEEIQERISGLGKVLGKGF